MHNVIVTGGSRGIGLAIATALAEAGHRVHVIARAQTEQLEAAVSQAQVQAAVRCCSTASI